MLGEEGWENCDGKRSSMKIVQLLEYGGRVCGMIMKKGEVVWKGYRLAFGRRFMYK